MHQRAILTIYALIGWTICGIVMTVGRRIVPMDIELLIHAAVVPVIFGLLTRAYFSQFPDSSPLATSATLLGFAMTLDALVVAPFIEHSYAMFGSVLGTWIPFTSIFASSYLVGRSVRHGRDRAARTASALSE